MTRVHPSEHGGAATHTLAQETIGEGGAEHVDAEHEIDRDAGVCRACDIESLDYLTIGGQFRTGNLSILALVAVALTKNNKIYA